MRFPCFRVSPAFEQALPSVAADLRDRLKRYGIADQVALKLVATIRDPSGAVADGRYTHRLIEVALDAQDRAFTLDHEAIHALKRLGLFTDAEWSALRRAAIRDTARMRDVRDRYPGFSARADQREQTELLVEEAVADMFGDYQAGRLRIADGLVKRLMGRVQQFFQAIRDVLHGRGFDSLLDVYDDTKLDIKTAVGAGSALRKIASGEVGRRTRSAEGVAASGDAAEAFLISRRGEPLSASEQAMADSILADQPGFAERARKALGWNRSGLGSEMVRQFVNQFQPIFDAEKRASGGKLRDARVSAAKFTELAMNDSGRLEMMMTAGPLRWNAAEGIAEIASGGKGLLDIFRPIKSPEDYKRFSLYAIARRSKRLAQEGRENLLTPAQIAEGLKLETPEFRQVFDDYQKFNKAMLDFAVDTGVIKAASRDVYASSMDYVPFYRVAEETGEIPGIATLRKLSNPDPKIRKLEGGTDKIGDVAEK